MSCPTDEVLAQFGDGALRGPELDSLEAHLDDCESCFTVVSAQLDPELPEEVLQALAPRYQILSELGRGGMGIVFAAHDSSLDRLVAVKLTRLRGGPDDEELRERFLQEARAAARIAHPNVVRVFDFGSAGGQAFLVMELIEGVSLRRWLASSRSESDILSVFRAAAEGLAAAHRAGWIHRDFKPENVFVSHEGRVAVGDFGLARVTSDEAPRPALQGRWGDVGDARLTASGVVPGTPRYLSPEQREGAPADARSDQYAFALSLHEALLGVLPGETPKRSENRRIPGWLRDTLAQALSVDPGARFPSMDALLRALHPPHSLSKKRKAFAAGAAVLLLVAAAVAAFRYLQPQPPAIALHHTALPEPYRPVVLLEGPELTLRLRVSDAHLRERFGPNFDGREEPFALVPTSRSEVWNRVTLVHQGFSGEDDARRDDLYELRVNVDDAQAVQHHGVAFGLDTNLGTIWYQQRGENWAPR